MSHIKISIGLLLTIYNSSTCTPHCNKEVKYYTNMQYKMFAWSAMQLQKSTANEVNVN